MITPIILPQLGDTMNEGTITRWFKKEGDKVQKGEALFEVLTDKANMEVEATASGYLRAVTRRENETVPTGEVIAYVSTTIDEPLEVDQITPTQEAAETLPSSDRVSAISTPATSPAGARKKQFVSPRARRLAEERGIDLASVSASSPSGRVVEADVIKFLEKQVTISPPALTPSKIPSTPPRLTPTPRAVSDSQSSEIIIPITGMRKIIAERMATSSREVARVTLTTEADATRLVELRAELNANADETKFTFTDLFVLLLSRALQKYPYMNATLQEDGIHQHGSVHIGIAVDTERGLLVPVIREVQSKGLGAISKRLKDLGELTRTGKVAAEDLSGSTFTITNLGQYEIDAFTPIINRPESAILGIGRISQKAAAFQGQLALRHMVMLSLAFDHRVVDGAPAARFLQEIKRLVESPALLLV